MCIAIYLKLLFEFRTSFIIFIGSTTTPPTQERNTKLSLYKDYLQSRYRTQKHSSTTQWPPNPTNKVIKLAMIQKENIQRGKLDDEFARHTITGKIDDILLYKTPVKLADIFFQVDEGRKFVLIEGAPGSGKSTLALHICQEWGKEKLFQEFDIAILVRLRDPLIRNAKTIADLLPCPDKVIANEIDSVIKSLNGKGILWVLDGWDELPSNLLPDSIINKLIQPGISQESPLHESTMIITSRPSSSAELHPLVSSRVEVLGFTPYQLEQYFTECLSGNLQAVQTLLDRIRENPVVEGSCYLPLNASIVVNCFLCDNHSLPTSNHGIFTSVVQSSLKRYLQDKLGKTTPVKNITSLDSLPSEIRTPFVQMCQLAYNGIKQNKATFTDKDLTTFSISKDIFDIGLVQTVPSVLGNGRLVYYCFLHLSIQELLAAIHMSLMSPKDQISVFEKLFDKPRFSAVFQFYTGITKLTTSRRFLSMLPRFLCPVPTSIFDLVRKVVKSEIKKSYSEPNPLLLSLFNCLYEAEDSSLCTFVSNLLNNKLYLSNNTMNPVDCLSVGYFVSVGANNNKFLLNLNCCSIGDQGCKFLVRGLSMCSLSYCELSLILFQNNIHDDGIHHIAQLSKNTLLSRLELHGNVIGTSGLSTLCEALSTNTSLKTMGLDSCSLTISEDNGTALYELLSKTTSLNHLSLSFNTVTSCHHIAAGLAVNKTLKTLNLSRCKLTDHSVEELLTGLINNIVELLIFGNDKISVNGINLLFRHMSTHCPKLNKLWIPSHLHFCKTLFNETNEERKRNRHHEIEIHNHKSYFFW